MEEEGKEEGGEDNGIARNIRWWGVGVVTIVTSPVDGIYSPT
jgi:hypothetical protein